MDKLNVDRTNPVQKGLAIAMILGLVYAGSLVINAFLPTIIEAAKNIWILAFVGGPLALATLYVVTNPLVVWGFFKTISWNLTKFLIKMDPLSVMDRFVDHLLKKQNKLNKAIESVSAQKLRLGRKIDELNHEIKNSLVLGKAAVDQGQTAAASIYGNKVTLNKGVLKNLDPLYSKCELNLKLMQQLEEACATKIAHLQDTINAKRDEFELIKEVSKGLRTAEDCIGSDNEAARLYGQSVKELEQQTTAMMGYMEEAERRLDPILKGVAIEKQANADQGMAELTQFLQQGISGLSSTQVIDTTGYKPGGIGQPVKEFKFLKKTS